MTEQEVANIVSMVASMIVEQPYSYKDCYKYICDNHNISNDLASHIIAVVQEARRNINNKNNTK